MKEIKQTNADTGTGPNDIQSVSKNGPCPKVSVAVIGFNGMAFIDDCLASVLDQEFSRTEYEVILIDNASSDGTPEYVEKNYPDVRVVKLKHNCGFNEACNKAFPFTKGEFLVFLPQDTIVHRKWISALVYLAESDQSIKVCWTNTVNPGMQEYGKKEREVYTGQIYFPEISWLGFTKLDILPYSSTPMDSLGIAGASFGIKRDILGELGTILDKNFHHYCGDNDLGLRINLLGYKVVMSPDAIVYHIDSGKQFLSPAILRRYFLGTIDRILLFYKNMTFIEFLLFSPFLTMGIPAKVFSMRFSLMVKLVMFSLILPFSLLIFASSLFFIGKITKNRAYIQADRQRENLWLLKKLLIKKE